jgi:hypothetical protein
MYGTAPATLTTVTGSETVDIYLSQARTSETMPRVAVTASGYVGSRCGEYFLPRNYKSLTRSHILGWRLEVIGMLINYQHTAENYPRSILKHVAKIPSLAPQIQEFAFPGPTGES